MSISTGTTYLLVAVLVSVCILIWLLGRFGRE